MLLQQGSKWDIGDAVHSSQYKEPSDETGGIDLPHHIAHGLTRLRHHHLHIHGQTPRGLVVFALPVKVNKDITTNYTKPCVKRYLLIKKNSETNSR